jgi:amino acid permease
MSVSNNLLVKEKVNDITKTKSNCDNTDEVEEVHFNGDDFSETSNSNNMSCLRRYCGPIGSGSLRGSTFAMASITFGAGCLAFPYAVSKCGPLIALIIFAICAACAYYTLYLLLINGVKAKIMDYNQLLEYATGKKTVFFSDINNIILCVGVIMSYQFTVYGFALELGGKYLQIDPLSSFNKLIIMASCFVLIQMPLSLLKNIATLQYASLIGTFALVYSIIVIVVEMFFYLPVYFDNGGSFIWYKPLNLGYLDTFSTFMFGFASHNGIFQVFTELGRPSVRRYHKVLNRSFLVELVLYIAISFCGYFSTFDDTPDIFLKRDDIPGFNDYFIQIAKVTLFICLHCIMAINYNIMRMSLRTMFFDGEQIPWLKDFFITLFTYIFTNTLVFFISDITQILGIIGGFCTIILCFVNPILIHIKLNDKPINSYENIFNIALMVFVTLFGSLATLKSLVGFFI